MTEAIIQIQDLEKRFRSKNTEVYALQGINLTIRKGDIFGIIGKSGAGKSTLVRCINMLERPTGGSVMFEGRDMFPGFADRPPQHGHDLPAVQPPHAADG